MRDGEKWEAVLRGKRQGIRKKCNGSKDERGRQRNGEIEGDSRRREDG